MQPTYKSLRAGEYLFHEGDPSFALYIVHRGVLSVRKAKGPAHVELAKISERGVIGEMAFFDRQPRSASAVAINEVEVVEVTFDSLDKLWKGVPDYLKSIMTSVVDRLRTADETIRRLQRHVVEETIKADDSLDAEKLAEAQAMIANAPDVKPVKKPEE